MNVVFKPIKTIKGKYVYDRGKNTVLKVNDEDYEELVQVEEKKINQQDSIVIKKYQSAGFLLPNTIKIIEHPCTNLLGHLISNHIEQLTIQVTQRCNLRCTYCTYGGFYDNKNRIHSNVDMSFEDAKRALDFYLAHSMETERLVLGFYGGEPLLKLDLIKQCVEYLKSKVNKSKPITFTVTTNGTLLTEETARYLFENDFSVLISLDGSKEEHDKYRIFVDGRGSFDTIMHNLKNIYEKYPDLFNRVQFNTVLNSNHNYKHLSLYFEEDELLGQANVMMSIVDQKTANSTRFDDEFYRASAFERFKLYLFMIGKLDQKFVPKHQLRHYVSIKRSYDLLSNNHNSGSKAHHAGPCIPGGKRLFINAFGEMFPCERVAENSKVMKIGNLDNGINLQKADTLLNVGRITESECKNCWAMFYCSICCQKADGGDTLSRSEKLQYCNNSKKNAYHEIAEVCTLRELGCLFDEKGFQNENINLPDNI